jgi:ubiquinone biosynthesis protein
MNLLNLIRHPEQARRLAEIVKILARYGMADWLKEIPFQTIRDMMASTETQAIGDLSEPARLRLALTDLGPTFIKLGQVLSTRADLVGPEIAEELRKLQAGTPADPFDVVRGTIRDELGKDPEDLFSEFEPEALSSASIGQVHRARLSDGRPVVVKVQHVGIQERVGLDLELLQGLAGLLQEHVPDARAYQPVATIREFRRTLLRELDFSSERNHMQQFTHNFAEDDTVHIPVVYRDMCSRQVLTMELLQGIPGSKPEKIRESGMNLNEFAKNAANVFLNMIFRDGFYHADPHPGNFILMDGGILGVIDCGMVGRIEESLRELFEDLLLLLLEGDSEGLADLLLQAGSAPADVDRAGFRSDVSDLLIEHGTQSLEDFDLGGALDRLTDIIRRHRVLMPPSASLLLKTLIMLEGTSRELSPTFSLAELLAPFKEQLIRERMDPRRWIRRLQQSIRDIDRLVRQGPRNLADILDRLQAGKLKIKHEHQRLEVISNRLMAALLIASLFLGSSMLLSRAFPPQVSEVSIFGALGCLIAMILGGRLLWVIRKDWR